MKSRSIALVIVLAVVACHKGSDVPGLQAEAVGLVQTYTPQVDALLHRVKELDQRGQALGGADHVAEAQRMWSEARAKVDQLRGLLQSIPASAQAAAKANTPEELEKLIDESRARIASLTTEASDQLDGVESWMWTAESARPAAPPAPPTPAPVEPPAGTPPAGTAPAGTPSPATPPPG